MEQAERQQIIDQEQLRLLKLGYFIQAGLTAFMSLFGLLYVFLGIFFSSFVPATNNGALQAPPEFIGHLFALFGGIFTLAGAMFAILQFLTGRSLEQQSRRTLCMIIAALTCIFIPYGTALGICTFVVLGRPSVQRLFTPADDRATRSWPVA